MNAPHAKIPVGILGATGLVGQRFVALLANHPWFELAAVVASERSAGKTYAEAARWNLPGDIPAAAAQLPVLAVGASLTPKLLFSGLDHETARQFEPVYAGRGHIVISNAAAFRMQPDIPLLIPEVNPNHLDWMGRQPWSKVGGAIITNPNCGAVGLTLALKPLHDAFGITAVTLVTMQAVSGAGYPGMPSLDILGNVIPHIPNEEEKLAEEPGKILDADFPVSVAVNRVPVRDGHLESVFIKLKKPAPLAAIRAALAEFSGEPQRLGLPSAPPRPLVVLDAADRPQPERDAGRGGGMAVTIGNLRADPVYDCRFTLLVHNTIRGAAGAAILNAELLVARGYA